MSIKPKQILQGFTNLFLDKFDRLDTEVKEEALRRYNHCATCTLRKGNKCRTDKEGIHILTGEPKRGCGCNLAAKTKSPSSECPLGKWYSMDEWSLYASSSIKVQYKNNRTGIIAGMELYEGDEDLDEGESLDDNEVYKKIKES